MIPTRLVMESAELFAKTGWQESADRANAELQRREEILELLSSRGVHHLQDLRRILLNSGR